MDIFQTITLHGKWLRCEEGGVRAYLRGADLSGADLRGAKLAYADLRGAKLAYADLRGADLRGADLRGADLRGAYLRGADLRGADLSGADLSGADLPGCAPVVADLPAVLSAAVTDQSLDMSEWHTCEATHCRAGWIIRLAGAAGAELEAAIGCNAAAALIYTASCPGRRVPDWSASNEDALEDIRREAEEWTKLYTKGKK